VENETVPTDGRVWLQAEALRDDGYKVSIICPASKRWPARHEEVEGLVIYRHPDWESGGGKFHLVLEFLNATFREVILAWQVFVKDRFHVIHAANPPDFIWLVALPFKLFGVKFVFDVHDLSPELFLSKFGTDHPWLHKLLLFFEGRSCRLADLVIATNDSYRTILMDRHHLPTDKLEIVRNDPVIIEDRKLQKQVSFEPPGERRHKILFVGAINSQDGVDILIEALGILKNEIGRTDFECTIAGDGTELESVRRQAHRLGLDGHVIFRGYIDDRNEVERLLTEADICVEPAPDNPLNRHSTFIKVLEYMAAGKPIVAFDLKETRCSAEGGCLYAKSGDVLGMANQMERLIRDAGLRETLGLIGRQRVKAKLNWNNARRNLLHAYQNLAVNRAR